MQSELIEFFRFNKLANGMLRKGDRYLLARGNAPVREIKITIDHVEFIRRLERLRYASQVDEEQRKQALDELSGTVTSMLGFGKKPVSAQQVDLVTNAAELSALPFELAVDAGGSPIFAVPGQPLVLTRRIRRESHGERPAWWSKPQVLFAFASPPGAGPKVPHNEHLDALKAALKPWIEPLAGFPQAVEDERSVLHTVPNASLKAIRQACSKANKEERPFTHLHLLAHGCAIGQDLERRFGLAMHDDTDTSKMVKVAPEQLRRKLAPFAEDLVVVTLAACDGGNQANSIAGGGSIAHELHSSGIPVVVASQFPLTFEGSTAFTRVFYQDVLAGHDIRDALYTTRSALYQHADVGHDWASLVAYVQLPEDYDDRLVEVALQAEMASLNTAQLWSDHLTVHQVRDPAAFEDVAGRLQSRIANLKGFLDQHEEQTAGRARNENLGLLGSAEKRLAELYFHRARLGDDTAEWMHQAEQALQLARSWYEKSFVGNLSHHWTGVQALSLEAVLTGGISRVGQWYAAVEAAETDSQREGEVWALGSLAELYLLAPLAGQGSRLDDAGRQLDELAGRVHRARLKPFPVQSTKRQLERYVQWWTKENGYFGGSPDLAGEAGRLREVLSRASKRMPPRSS
jgi:hypothetical protein